jgi:hypothetical protein
MAVTVILQSSSFPIEAAITSKCMKPIAIGQQCRDTLQCVTGAFCDLSISKCLPLPSKGSECGNSIYCASGLGCDYNKDITCQPLSPNRECLMGVYGPSLCASGSVCYSGKCGPLKTGPGAVCSDISMLCAPRTGCDLTETQGNICVPVANPGQKCTTDAGCKNGLYCNLRQLKCEARITKDAKCTGSGGKECASGLTCLPNTNIFTKLLKPLTCQKIPSKVGDTCTEKCLNGLVCGDAADLVTRKFRS